MAESRKYTSGVTAALISLCRGRCYWPNCDEPVIHMIESEPILNLEIAHIHAVNPGGKRFNSEMAAQERNSFANLILLCKVHHVRIDGHESDYYPVQLLQQWKRAREASGQAALRGLRGLTEERLQEYIGAAFKSFLSEATAAIAELAQIAPDAASTLRTLVDELADPRLHGLGLDPDVVAMLSRASIDLRGVNTDVVSQLHDAANKLRGLGESASTLRAAADDLRWVPDAVGPLVQAAAELRKLRGYM